MLEWHRVRLKWVQSDTARVFQKADNLKSHLKWLEIKAAWFLSHQNVVNITSTSNFDACDGKTRSDVDLTSLSSFQAHFYARPSQRSRRFVNWMFLAHFAQHSQEFTGESHFTICCLTGIFDTRSRILRLFFSSHTSSSLFVPQPPLSGVWWTCGFLHLFSAALTGRDT